MCGTCVFGYTGVLHILDLFAFFHVLYFPSPAHLFLSYFRRKRLVSFFGKIAGNAILWSPLVCLRFPHDGSCSALLMSEDLKLQREPIEEFDAAG